MVIFTELEPLKTVQEPFSILFHGRPKEPLTIPVSKLVEKNRKSDYLVEVRQKRSTNQPTYRGLHGCSYNESSSPATMQCPQYEGQLQQLEEVVGGYWQDRYSKKLPSEHDREKHTKYYAPIIAALASYKPLLISIILELASQTSTSSTADQPLSSVGQTFVMEASPVCERTDKLFYSPATDNVISRTIYSDPDGLPALVYYEGELNFQKTGHPGRAFGSDAVSMGYEVSAQMPYRHRADEMLPTHQGLMFDGYVACIQLLDVSHQKDLFQEHKTSIGTAFYQLPQDRPSFVHDMVKLCHENHFDVFKWLLTCDLYDPSIEEFEPILGERLGKVGPLFKRVIA